MKLLAVVFLLLAPVSGFIKEKNKPVPATRALVETSSDALRRRSLGSSRNLGGSMPVPPPPSSKGKGGDEPSGKGKGGDEPSGKGKGGDEPSGKGKGGSAPKSDGKGKGGSEPSKSGGKGKGGSKGKGKGKGGSKSDGKGKGGSKSDGKGKGGSKSDGKGKGGSKGSKGKGKGGPDSGKGKGDSGKGKGDSGKGKGDSGKGKGDSGKGKGGVPEGKGKGVASCTVVPILFYNEDLLAGEYTNDVGFGLNQVPFFDPETLEQIGTYSDFAVDIPDSEECIATGAFSFGTPGADGKYPSQVEISFTCGSQQNAVTGGTGEYGCASGFEEFAFQDETAGLLGTELNICGALCPQAAA